MTAKAVLIVGGSTDPHVGAVALELEKLSSEIVVIDPQKAGEDWSIELSFDKSGSKGWILRDEASYDLHGFSAVWWRAKPTAIHEMTGVASSTAQAFAHREWRELFQSLEEFTPQALWVNSLAATHGARHKPIQLKLAHRFGFLIPDTRITNNYHAVCGFVEDREAIYKPLTWYFRPPNEVLYTSSIGINDVIRSEDEITVAPGIFQERINKRYELRITIVGHRVYPVGIDSQKNKESKLDWRRVQTELDYFEAQLPMTVEHKLLGLHRALKLQFAAYDLAVTDSDEYLFFEVNPTGQWLWLEERLNVPISREVAVLLSGSWDVKVT